jgi:hypothetical protein
MAVNSIASQNETYLGQNKYPGRGIIIGETPSEEYLVQIYWIMGRSKNSRNRLFVIENDFVKTEIFDENIEGDRSLIIYYPIKSINNFHIISNGDQTETIYNFINNNKSFKNALDTKEFESDPPNYTPRISGFIDLRSENSSYGLSVLKTIDHQKESCQRNYFYYNKFIKGFGHCIHTYNDDGNPIPSFSKEPYLIKLYEDIDDNIKYIWDLLNTDNKVSVLVKYISKETKQTILKIINKNNR